MGRVEGRGEEREMIVKLTLTRRTASYLHQCVSIHKQSQTNQKTSYFATDDD